GVLRRSDLRTRCYVRAWKYAVANPSRAEKCDSSQPYHRSIACISYRFHRGMDRFSSLDHIGWSSCRPLISEESIVVTPSTPVNSTLICLAVSDAVNPSGKSGALNFPIFLP